MSVHPVDHKGEITVLTHQVYTLSDFIHAALQLLISVSSFLTFGFFALPQLIRNFDLFYAYFTGYRLKVVIVDERVSALKPSAI